MSNDFLDSWRTEGILQVEQNFNIFCQLVDEAKKLARANRYDEAAIQATLAAYHAQRRHSGLFASPELEQVLSTIGQEVISTGTSVRRALPRVERVLHIGTNMSVLSGNPRLIRRWIQQDTT